jgi:hypothetical protein
MIKRIRVYGLGNGEAKVVLGVLRNWQRRCNSALVREALEQRTREKYTVRAYS